MLIAFQNMTNKFEQEKNIKAGSYTLMIVALILFLFFIISWKIPKQEEPLLDEGIEVNLGNSDFGSGDVPPMMPGEPAPEQAEQKTSAPKASPPAAQPLTSDDDNNNPDAAELPKPVANTTPKPKPHTNNTVTTAKPTKEPPAPPQPKPKATMGAYKGGNGPGGNNQDGFNNVKNQGIAGGNGDQGKSNGNINSDNYKGNGGSGTGGVTVVRGNRSVVRATRLEGDFSQSATLYVDVKVDERGSGTFIRVTKGINQSQYTNIIRQRLASRDIQFNASGEESIVNIRVDFKVN